MNHFAPTRPLADPAAANHSARAWLPERRADGPSPFPCLPDDGDTILQSHQRCAAVGLARHQLPDFTPVARGELGATRERNRRLHEHAAPVMAMLQEQIAGSHSMVLLADACGVVIHATGDDDFLARASKVALQPGADWSEAVKGTNAIGTALIAEAPTRVHADEHYLSANAFLSCSAAPIHDPRGNLLGVLDVTGDHLRHHPHTMGLVSMSVRMIENRWLDDDFRHALRLHLHPRADCIGSLLEGVVAVSPDGRLIGANRSALAHLRLSPAALRMQSTTGLFGLPVGVLVDHARAAWAAGPVATLPLTLPDGRVLQARARIGWARSFAAGGAPDVAADAPAGLPTPAGASIADGTDGASHPPTHAPAPIAAAAPARGGLAGLDTGDAALHTAIDRVRRVIDRGIPVLISGETGTGKELLARAIHDDSARSAMPFVAVNCASIPEALIESELFGYEDGAFTGARRRGAVGKIVHAHGGTLFLDEIGDMPLTLQARLLRVLQERSVTPLGSHRAIPVDITLISASHRDLRAMIRDKLFREDLYYRLNGLAVKLPPLRERRDLGVLVPRILAQVAAPGSAPRPSPALMQRLSAYRWPGNLRQLASVLATAAALAGGEPVIGCEHLGEDLLDDADAAGTGPAGAWGSAPGEAPGATPEAWPGACAGGIPGASAGGSAGASAGASAGGSVGASAGGSVGTSAGGSVGTSAGGSVGTSAGGSVGASPGALPWSPRIGEPAAAGRHAAAPTFGGAVPAPPYVDPLPPAPAPCPRTLEEAELALIQEALAAEGGNISAASKRLGIARNTIYRRLRWNAAE